MERAVGMEILSYLRGGKDVDVESIARTNPELLARAVMYLLSRGGYHRERLVKALVKLINYASPAYRGVAWRIIQEIPLSHLLYVTKVIEKNKENSRRLRHAIATKLALAPENEIIRAFFIAPELYRKMFRYLKLPREVFNNKPIKSPAYRMAYRLSQLSTGEAFGELHLVPSDLLAYGVPLHMVMQYVTNIHEAEMLAYKVKSDDFFRHGRWFRNILGDEKYEKIALEKVKKVRDPLSFLAIKDHLEATGAVTPKLMELMEQRGREALDAIMRDFKLERIALIVDVSGSMEAAVEITKKLYEAFSRVSTITDLIAFREYAFEVSLGRLTDLQPDGMTSIGSAIVLLAQRISQRGGAYPQAILIVSDLAENTKPYLRHTLNLLERFGKPPIIVIHCGDRHDLAIDYPHAKIPVDKFHPRLLMDIMKQIARLTAKVAVEEKEITKAVKERRPVEEELGAIKLPERPKITYKPGFLEVILCEPWREEYWSWAVGS